MKKSTLFKTLTLALGFLLLATSGWGQTTIFTETMGTVSANTSIAAHEAANGFANVQFTMTDGGAANPADIRQTSISSGYTGASGGANVFFTGTAGDRGFAIEGINASTYTNLKVQFGYRKESATELPTLTLDYWNGTEYVNVPFTFNEVVTAGVAWYLSPETSLPSAAQIDGLRIRWVKSGTVSVRIDDVRLVGTSATPTPTLTVAPTSLTGFTYVEGSGPSAAQQFSVSGTSLDNSDVTVTAPANYEISATEGGIYGASVTLTAFGGGATPIWVRLAGGLVPGAYSGNVSVAGGAATVVNVAVSGRVTADCPPLAFPFFENFTSPVGSQLVHYCWSAHSGAGTNTITVTAPTISFPGYLGSGIGNQVTLTTSGEDVNRTFTAQTSGTVYASFLVNVTSANTVGDYFFHVGETSIGTFRGRVFVRRDEANKLAFGIGQGPAAPTYSGFDYDLNTTYLIVLKYEIIDGASNDVSSIFINPPLNASIPTTGWISNTDAAAADPAQLGSVALRQGTAANAAALILDGIRVSTNWADIVGELPATPTLDVAPTSLTGFTYVEGSGPSAAQSFSVSGTALDGTDVIVTAPANYVVSATEGGTYGASVTLTAFSGAATPVWVRLAGGLAPGDYSGNVSVTGGGATAVNLAVSGSVTAPPPTFAVTFNVNMSAASGFNPATHVVHIAGNFPAPNHWSEPGSNADLRLNRVDETMIWSTTLYLPAGNVSYKFFSTHRAAGWGGGEWDGDPNRQITVTGPMTVNDVFGSQPGATAMPVIPVTAAVINLFPNPARTVLNIAANEMISEVRIIDMLGQVVYSATASGNSHLVNVGDLRYGIYFVQIKTHTGIQTKRVQVVK
jgi:hypothetical protein